MPDIARAAPAALMGSSGPVTLGAGYTTDLGWTFPLAVLGTVNSAPLFTYGVNSFMFIYTIAVALAGFPMSISIQLLRPDLSPTTPITIQVGSDAIGAVGTKIVTFGDRGTDQTADATQGFCTGLFLFQFFKFGGAAASITDARLFVMTRP